MGGNAPPRLVIRHPVHKKDDVPRHFVDQNVENLEHAFGEKTRLTRDLEHTEAEEGINAFAKPEILKRGFNVARQGFERNFVRIDSIAIDHYFYEFGMARFFFALKRDRLPQYGIDDCFCERFHNSAGSPLGIKNFLPEGHRTNPLQGRFVEIGPWERLWIVILISL